MEILIGEIGKNSWEINSRPGLYIIGNHSCNFVKAGAELMEVPFWSKLVGEVVGPVKSGRRP